MQDRFKYRAINMRTKEIIYIDSFYWFEENGVSEIDSNNTGSGSFDEYWINQCTGLKDKNGKLIYEGDIVKYLGGTVNKKFVKYITKWNDNMGQFYISKINPNEYDNWKDWHLGRHDLDYEVIGNIYENPELLEVK